MPKNKLDGYSCLFKLKKKDINEVINEFRKEISNTSKNFVDILPVNEEIKEFLNQPITINLGKTPTPSPKFTEQDKDFLELIYQLNQVYQKTDEYDGKKS